MTEKYTVKVINKKTEKMTIVSMTLNDIKWVLQNKTSKYHYKEMIEQTNLKLNNECQKEK